MGQQQLLLIILGVIVVGVAVAGGIVLFKSQAVSQNRDAVWADLTQIGARAQAFYRRPSALGGGGKEFTAFRLLASEAFNDNGTYSISTQNQTQLILEGVGTEVGNNNTSPVYVKMIVEADSMYVDDASIN